MSPKAQRPLRGAKTLSSPNNRPSGEASVPPAPAGRELHWGWLQAMHAEVYTWGLGINELLKCWEAVC